MKTFIRTIAVLVVLNLATGCFASAQNAPGKTGPEVAKKEMEAAKKEMEIAKEEMKKAGQEMKAAMQYEIATSLAESAQRQVGTAERLAEDVGLMEPFFRSMAIAQKPPLPPSYSGDGPVLVIPAAEIKAQDLVTIMEDMSVMSRILDKKLDLFPGGMFRGGYGSGLNFSFFGSTGADSTEAIFLQGYGALFLMKVNFPLSPPAEVEKEKIEEPADPIWEETKREIYAPEDVGRHRRVPAAKYDVEKVEDLKRKLIKALKHAANIRNLKPDESIIITVTGEGDQVSGTIRLLIKQSTIDADDEDEEVRVYQGPFSDEMGFSPTVMTIRVKKSDVDAFAKGKLDFDTFRQKVQIFTY